MSGTVTRGMVPSSLAARGWDRPRPASVASGAGSRISNHTDADDGLPASPALIGPARPWYPITSPKHTGATMRRLSLLTLLLLVPFVAAPAPPPEAGGAPAGARHPGAVGRDGHVRHRAG